MHGEGVGVAVGWRVEGVSGVGVGVSVGAGAGVGVVNGWSLGAVNAAAMCAFRGWGVVLGCDVRGQPFAAGW